MTSYQLYRDRHSLVAQLMTVPPPTVSSTVYIASNIPAALIQ